MSHNNRGAPSGPRRGQNQRIASGARTAPYSRPETSKTTSSTGKQWPPNQITIRGASGPTWIVVANLLRGTSEADIHETFQQFGEIEDIKPRKAPSENHPSIAFEIAFTARASANTAIEKLDGALADGRLLQVIYRDAAKFNGGSDAFASKKTSAPIASASAQKELFPSIPSGPKAQQRQSRSNNGKEVLNNKAPQTSGNGNGKAPIPDQSLQSRLMTAAELKALQKQQAKAAAVRKVVPAVPTEPKGTISTPATNVAIPLAKRITLPLAMRLNEEAKKNGPASSLTPGGLSKKQKAKGKGKAKNADGMEVD